MGVQQQPAQRGRSAQSPCLQAASREVSERFASIPSPRTVTDALDGLVDLADTATALRALVKGGWGDLPNPGDGRTLQRWRVLAEVAARDLALAKLLESHADALAIRWEFGFRERPGRDDVWGVWCAEPPSARLQVRAVAGSGSSVHLDGTKAWCSGAAFVNCALVSGWNEAGQQCLVAVRMSQPHVYVTNQGWHAVGMAAAQSVDVVFDGAHAELVGLPGAYVARPGFNHGAAGVSACWYGAATGIADILKRSLHSRPDNVHALAHLGAIDVALVQAAAQLREAATAIDADPGEPCQRAVRRARLAVESAAELVLTRATRALGAGPLCKDARLAHLLSDLPVFIRQSHAERDLATHGLDLASDELNPWTL